MTDPSVTPPQEADRPLHLNATSSGPQSQDWQGAGQTNAGPLYYRWVTDSDLEMRIDLPSGETLLSTIGWATPELAATHRQDAAASFARRAASLASGSVAGQKRRVRRLPLPSGKLYLGLNTGSPTWWRPRALIGRTTDGASRIMLGWLNACVYATYESAKPS